MDPSSTFTARAKIAWLAALLAGATFVLFAPAIRFDYLDYDDGVYVYANKDVLRGVTLDGVRYAFTSIAGGSWMPLTWLSHMLDVTIFGRGPAGPHAVNIMLHSLSVSLLFLVLQRVTGRFWPSIFTAALFAFHPLRNESVVWIAERKDVLSTMFWMLGLLAYARYAEKPEWKRFLVVALCLVLGLMAKPMLVTFPFVLLLLDFWPLKRLGGDWSSFKQNLWPRVREKLPFFLVIILLCVATFWSQKHSGAVSGSDSSILTRSCQIVGNYAFYAQKIFLPTRLNVLHPVIATSTAQAVVFALAFAAVTSLAIWRLFRQPWLAVGWFWFLGTLVPVVGVVPVGHISVAERYSYLPSVGLVILVVWGVAELVRNRPRAQHAASVIGATAAVCCAVAARADLPRWRDSLALFTSAVQTEPHAVAYNNVAVAYLDRREFAQAIEPLTRALEMDPRYVKAYINRALAYQKTGRTEEAKRDYEQLIRIEPRNAEGYNNRADLLMDLGRLDDAINDFTSAIRLSPYAPHSYNNRASARFMKGDFAVAIQDCNQAIELNPRYANAYNTRGNIYSRTGDLLRALADYNHAIKLSPADSLTYNNRAAAHFRLKHFDAAWADLRRCQELGGTPHEGLVRALTESGSQQK